MQDFSLNNTLTNIVRTAYLPVLDNEATIKASPLFSKIQKKPTQSLETDGVSLFGINGGTGFSTEGVNVPIAGAQMYNKWIVKPKDLYTTIGISNKAIQLGKGGTMSVVNALDHEIKSARASGSHTLGRALFGNGTGVLCRIKALGSSGNTITIHDDDNAKNLIEGMTIDIYQTGGTSPQTNGSARRIVSIDRENNTFTISGSAATFSAGFITTQMSYNNEITGLGAIFDDNISSLWGVAKADHPIMKPIVKTADNDLTDDVILDAVMEASDVKNSSIDTLIFGKKAYKHYSDYLKVMNHRIEDNSRKLEGGFTSAEFLFGNRTVDIMYDKFMPDNEVWGIESGKCAFYETGWNFATANDSAAFERIDGTSTFGALLANYTEFFCSNPGGCLRITNCA